MASDAPLTVDVWSDIACPWCWVGKRHLERAAAELGRPLRVTWRAFELDPSAPKEIEPKPYSDRLAAKYGTSPAEAQGMIDRMTEVGAKVGIDFRFDRAQPTNTFDGHRLLAWAAQTAPERQDALKEALFSAYLHAGQRITDPEVLADAAEAAGLERDAAQEVLRSDAYAEEVRGEEAAAQQIGVRGVPFFVLAGRLAVSGAQPPEVLVDALRQAESMAEPGEAPAGDACGPDGCAVPSE